VDNNLYTLPKLGRFAWENTLVQPNQGKRSVIMGMEDGPNALDPAVENSQDAVRLFARGPPLGAGTVSVSG